MNPLHSLIVGALLAVCAAFSAAGAEPARKVRVACIGDSLTQGAGVEDQARDSYPAQLQRMLGDGYDVTNLGVGSCTLIRKGSPNVWRTLKRVEAANPGPDIVVISLGTNDTCGGSRKCWKHKDDFPGDCRDLVDALRALPSKPRIWLCAPTPMVLETPGLEAGRKNDLSERIPRLRELIGVIKAIAEEKKTGFIDLNTPLSARPELFKEKDGVHLRKEGYAVVAGLVHQALRAGAAAETTRDFEGQIAAAPTASKPAAKVPESTLAKALVWQGVAIQEDEYTIWGASPVVAEGKVHLFAARWPEANVDPAWRKSSEIAHYVADKPEGPFRFQEVVLKGNGRTGEWDAFAPHNPEIQRFGDTFALCVPR
jgi:lysophospholipase L1-like esterase